MWHNVTKALIDIVRKGIIIVTCETEVKMQNTYFYSLANLFRGEVVKGVVLMSKQGLLRIIRLLLKIILVLVIKYWHQKSIFIFLNKDASKPQCLASAKEASVSHSM